MIYLKVAYLGLGGLIPNVVFGDNNQCHFVRSWGKEVLFLSTIFSLRVWRDDNILKRERIFAGVPGEKP